MILVWKFDQDFREALTPAKMSVLSLTLKIFGSNNIKQMISRWWKIGVYVLGRAGNNKDQRLLDQNCSNHFLTGFIIFVLKRRNPYYYLSMTWPRLYILLASRPMHPRLLQWPPTDWNNQLFAPSPSSKKNRLQQFIIFPCFIMMLNPPI